MREMRWTRIVSVGVVFISAAVWGATPVAAGDGVVWWRETRASVASIDAAEDGSVYIAGTRLTDEGGRMVAARYGPAGRLIWRTWRPGLSFSARGTAVVAAPGGGAYVAGSSHRIRKHDLSPPVYAVIRRHSSSGALRWKVRIPLPPQAIGGEISGLAADRRGVVAAINFYASSNYGGIFHDGQVWAFDAAGGLEWRRDFEAPGISGTFDGVGDVAIGPNGLVYAVGHVDRTHRDDLTDPPSDEDLLIQQLSRAGAVRWSRTFRDPGRADRDDAVSVAVRPGLVVVGGYVDGQPPTLAYVPAFRSRAWVGAFDTRGNRLWSHRWGDRTPTREVTSVSIAPWGAVYVAAVRDRPHHPSSVVRRYARDGTLIRERPRTGMVAAVATTPGALFVASGDRLERWRR